MARKAKPAPKPTAKQAARPPKRVAPRKSRAIVEEELESDDEVETESLPAFGFTSDPDLDLINRESYTQSTEEIQQTDVFEDAKRICEERGDVPRFRIYKGGEYLTEVSGSFSWERVRREFGPGSYKVSARSKANGQVVKTQTLNIANPKVREDDDWFTDNKEAEETEQAQPNPLDYAAYTAGIQERAAAQAKSDSNQMFSGLAAILAAIVPKQNNDNSQVLTMMMEMQRTQMEAIRNQSQQSIEMFKLMMAQKPEKPEFDTLKIMSLLQNAEQKAESRTEKWYELIEKKAEALAEEKAAAHESDDDEKEESLATKLIKGFVPILAQTMANQSQTSAVPLTPEQQRVVAQNQERLQIERQARAREEKDKQITKRMQAATAVSAQAVNPAGITTVVQNKPETVIPFKPMPNINGQAQIEKIEQSASVRAINPGSANGNTTTGLKSGGNVTEKDKVLELVLPDIGQAMLLRSDAKKTCEKTLLKLEKKGFSRQTVASLFTLEDFNAVAKKFNLPEEAQPWLKEFHEHLQTAPGKKPREASQNQATRNL